MNKINPFLLNIPRSALHLPDNDRNLFVQTSKTSLDFT